jgi:tripartite-type tricarboxylate transporter receptor subunit TctC
MKSTVKAVLGVLAGAVIASAGAQAQTAATFPNKPIRLIIPYGPGGLTDITARLIAEPLRDVLGQPVVVESKPGGSGIVGMQELIRAKPDGHTWYIGVNTSQLLNPIVRAHEMPFDVRKVLQPVTRLVEAPQVFMTTLVNFPPKTVKEFIEYAKARPGELNQAIIGTGSNSHFDFLVMGKLFGFKLVTVPARSGAASAAIDVINGAIHVAMMNAATYTPMVKGGKLRAIAVTGDARTADLPDVPTLKEQGYTQFGVGTWTGLFVAAGTPPDIVEKIHGAVVGVLNSEKMRAQLPKFTVAAIPNKSPQEFKDWLDAEFAKWTPIADEFREELGMPPKK